MTDSTILVDAENAGSPNNKRADNRAQRRVLSIEVVKGPTTGLTQTLDTGHGVVGRAASADVKIVDETVSQFHVELTTEANDIFVRDLGSRNGTRVGGGAIFLDRGRVPSGTTLTLGNSEIKITTTGDVVTAKRSTATSFGALVGASIVMRELYAELEKLTRTRFSVLIEGETGTGKELAARGLHDQSARAAEPFLPVNCAALPPSIAESVLFGQGERLGIFESAKAGTVLLDHVDALPPEVQAKLLRVLDHHEVVPVGETTPRRFEARIVSIATNSLRALVNQGVFREDLYFRLAQARVTMPSLEKHSEDKKPLALHFLGLYEAANARSFDQEALDAIGKRTYAGNVRELRNVVERASALAEGSEISLQDLAFERALADIKPSSPTVEEAASPPVTTSVAPAADQPLEAFKEAKRNVIDDFERKYLEQLLARAGKNVSKAAALAGIERQSLRDLLKRHGLRGSDE
jgi:DNA-binding NtrC family response regulator